MHANTKSITIEDSDCYDEQRELFITTLTHDLKNSVQAQLISLNLLNEETLGSLNSEQKEMIEMIIESVGFTKNLLYSVLNTFLYEQGNVNLNLINFNIDELMINCINEAKILAADKNMKIDYNAVELEIVADPTQLRRVITNLINNAITYGYKNSTLEIKIFKINNRIQFEFSNLGDPISDELKNKLFDKYVTGGNKFEKLGFGLGLYSSKKIIEAHNGRISVDSVGNKVTFYFDVPINDKNIISLFNFV